MNGGSLLNVLIQTIRAKFTGILTKLRFLTSWNYVKTRIVVRIREFFTTLIGVKPRNKDDYFTVGRWMISKRLFYAAIIIVGVVSLWYISSETSLFKRFEKNGLTTYKYNSIRLRTAKGRVRITGKSGYLAYEGDVEGGYVTGEGTLYNPEGNIVYSGTFSQNKYEGIGVENYNSGKLHYRGNFHENLYEGEGTLYRENGTREYVGDFSQGMKNGSGVLYDSGENEVFTGTFSSDNIVYSELLGKSAGEVAECYKGERELYMTDAESVVVMDAIQALYHGVGDPEALDDEEKVDAVYVLSDEFSFGNNVIHTITEAKDLFGNPVYEGNSGVIMPEAVAINKLNERKTVLSGPVQMEVDNSFSDVATIEEYDRNYPVYIYSFQRGELLYSFVCGEREDEFVFYFITGADGAEDAENAA